MVSEVVTDAAKEGRTPALAIIYDDLMRKYWEEMTGTTCHIVLWLRFVDGVHAVRKDRGEVQVGCQHGKP